MPPVDVAQARWPFCWHEKILSKMDFRWEPYFIQCHRPHCIVALIRCSVWEQTRHGLVVLFVSLPLLSSSIGHQIIMTNLNISSSIKICIFYCEILSVYILEIWEILNQIFVWDLKFFIELLYVRSFLLMWCSKFLITLISQGFRNTLKNSLDYLF